MCLVQAFNCASGLGRHLSPHIGTSQVRRLRTTEPALFAFTTGLADAPGGTCRCTNNATGVSYGQQFSRNTFTRQLSLLRSILLLAFSRFSSPQARHALAASGAGRTNGLTITPPSHRSRHFCTADATLCRQAARTHCAVPGRRDIDRMFNYAAEQGEFAPAAFAAA
jgi:hypothetical protein